MTIPSGREVWHGSLGLWMAVPLLMQGIMPANTSGLNVMSLMIQTCSM